MRPQAVQHPAAADQCVYCEAHDRPPSIFPYLWAGEFWWMHSECSAFWYEERRAEMRAPDDVLELFV